MPGGELAFQLRIHPRGYWICLVTTLANQVELWMVPDTGSPVSAISPAMKNHLLAQGLVQPSGNPYRYLLRSLTAQQQPLPELEVAVLARLGRIGADAVLGLDFLRLFRRLHFDIDTLQLVLEVR